MKKNVFLAFALVLLSTSMFPQLVTTGHSTTTLNVYPGESIQDAINLANSGDVLLVHSGTYYEHVVVNKTLSLVGEDKYNTIIDGNGTETVIKIEADNINIIGFTIRNGGPYAPESGIYVYFSSGHNISNNIITNNIAWGILLEESSNNIVSNNTISNNYDGFKLTQSSSNTIFGNNITANSYTGIEISESSNNIIYINNISANNYNGIGLWDSSFNTIYGNNIMANDNGNIYLWASSNNSIYKNLITGSEWQGIRLDCSSSNSIYENNITNNKYGIELYSIQELVSLNNIIYHNNFINNSQQVRIQDSTNVWDDGYPSGGNYWSDYEERYPRARAMVM